MIAYIFYPIFALTITVLVCFIRKKQIVRGFVSMPSPRHHLRPPGGGEGVGSRRGQLKPLLRPLVAIIFGFSKNQCAHVFSVLFPVIACNKLLEKAPCVDAEVFCVKVFPCTKVKTKHLGIFLSFSIVR